MLIGPRCNSFSTRIEFHFPILMPPAVPGIEEISNGSLLPSQFRVCSGNDEERFAPGEHALESLSKTTNGSFLSSLSPEVDLGNGVAVFLRKCSIVDDQQTRAAQQ